jgi:outer membrane protein insertion porin family
MRILPFLCLLLFVTVFSSSEEPSVSRQFNLVNIKLMGVKGLEKKQIRDIMNLKRGSSYDQYMFMYLPNLDLKRIELNYRQNGYFGARTGWSVEFIGGEASKRRLIITVDEGKRALVSSIKVVGNITGEQSKMLIPKTLLALNSPYKSSLVHQGKVLLQEELGRWGYPFVMVEAFPSFSEDFTEVDVTFSVETGELMSIGQVKIVHSGEKHDFNDTTIRRYLTFSSGKPYNLDDIYESRRRLFSTGILDDVKIVPTTSEKPSQVDLTVIIREGKSRRIEVMPGYLSPDRAKMAVKWAHLNLFGHTEQFNIGTRGSYAVITKEYDYGADVSYTVPFVLGFPPTWITVPYYEYSYILQKLQRKANDKDIVTWENYYNYRKQGVDTSLKHILARYWSLQEGLRVELVKVQNYIVPSPEVVANPYYGQGWSNTIRLYGTLSRDTRKGKSGEYDAFNPIDGSYGFGAAEVAGGPLGGDFDFYKLAFDTSRYHPAALGAVLGLHIRVATSLPYSETPFVPAWERLYAGGAYSVRGIRDNHLGPLYTDGTAVGGQFLSYGNMELRFPFFKPKTRLWGLDLSPFWGGIFLDVGELVVDINRINTKDIVGGAGFGLRYNTIVGPVRIDFAHELSQKAHLYYYLALGHCF